MKYHASLCSGEGGFDLAAERMGWSNALMCEINPFCKFILQHYWPKAIIEHDLNTTNFTIYRGLIDVLSAGFPCQPFSNAGQQQGTADNRYQWPGVFKAIQCMQPPQVVLENVYGLVGYQRGLALQQVCADLECEGYEVQPFIIPACAVNAPHERYRVWIVAHSHRNHERRQRKCRNLSKETGAPEGQAQRENWQRLWDRLGDVRKNELQQAIANAGRKRYKQFSFAGQQPGKPKPGIAGSNGAVANPDTTGREQPSTGGEPGAPQPLAGLSVTQWHNWPSVMPVCSGDDGVSYGLDFKTFRWINNKSLQAHGNAIVPPIAYEIFKAIEATENKIFKPKKQQ